MRSTPTSTGGGSGSVTALSKVATALNTWTSVLAAVAIILLMLHVILEVVLRTLFNNPLPGTLEIVSNWWMIIIAFAGLGYAKVRDEHISVSLLGDALPRSVQALNSVIVELVTIVILGMVAYYSWQEALDAMARTETSSGVVRIPIWPARYLVPLGVSLFALAALNSLVEKVRAEYGARKRGAMTAKGEA